MQRSLCLACICVSGPSSECARCPDIDLYLFEFVSIFAFVFVFLPVFVFVSVFVFVCVSVFASVCLAGAWNVQGVEAFIWDTLITYADF